MQTGLSRDAFIDTALAVADDEGLDSVTIRRLADIHGVTPMALYRYFADKERIFDALAARLLDDVVIPEPDKRPWHEQVTDLLSAFIAGLREHPNAAILVLHRILESDAGRNVTERMLALLAEAGFAVNAAAETASQALCSLVTLVITEPGRRHGGDVEAQEAAIRGQRAALLSLDPRHYSHIVDAADALARCASEKVYYERGLRMIVAGIRGSHMALTDERSRSPKASGPPRRKSATAKPSTTKKRPAGNTKRAPAKKTPAAAKRSS